MKTPLKLVLATLVGAAILAGAIGWAGAGAPGAPTWMHRSMAGWGMPHHCGDCSGASGTAVPGADVTIADVAFAPDALRIQVGETVTWSNRDSFAHTITSDDGLFDSGLLEEGGSWSWTFTTPGTYRYHCTPHALQESDGTWSGQTGLVVVEA